MMTWIGVGDEVQAEVYLYNRPFTEAHLEANGKDFLENLNADGLKTAIAYAEPSLANGQAGKAVINRVTVMKDIWAKYKNG